MQHRQYKILLLFTLFFFSSYSQLIQKLEIIGNKNFSDKEYYEWLNFNYDLLPFQHAKDTITYIISHNLKSNGYFNFKIDSIKKIDLNNSSNYDLNIYVYEGEPTFIKNVFVDGADSVRIKRIIKSFDFLIEKIFSQLSINNTIEELLIYEENNGFPFIIIKIKSISFYFDSTTEKNYADIFLLVDKGIESKFNIIEIIGNENTKDFVIIRNINIANGEQYSQKKLEDIPRKLNRLRFFEPVPNPVFLLNSKNNGILQITVTEKSTNSFDGIIGYIPATNKDESSYVTGLVNISLRNLFGTGRAFAIRWQKIDKFSQELELKYLEPYLLDFPFNINVGLFQRIQDTSFVHRKIDGAVEYMVNDDFSVSVLFNTESIIPTINEYSVFTVYNSTLYSIGLNAKYDSRDDPYSPTEGFFLINSYLFSQKKINGPEKYLTVGMQKKINLQKLSIDFSYFIQLLKRQIIALGIHGKEIKGSLLEVSDLYFLGGANSLRGYRENQFLGSRIFWSNLEYRLLLTRRTFGFLFFDTGYYLRNADFKKNISESSAFKYGYGLGLNLETTLGTLNVSFALGKGDSFSDGKIHFGLINEF